MLIVSYSVQWHVFTCFHIFSNICNWDVCGDAPGSGNKQRPWDVSGCMRKAWFHVNKSTSNWPSEVVIFSMRRTAMPCGPVSMVRFARLTKYIFNLWFYQAPTNPWQIQWLNWELGLTTISTLQVMSPKSRHRALWKKLSWGCLLLAHLGQACQQNIGGLRLTDYCTRGQLHPWWPATFGKCT